VGNLSEQELKAAVLDWFEKHSTGEKTKYYLKDVVRGLPQFDKHEINKAVNACIVDGTLMWFSTGSTSMLVLPRFFKG
jgi:hypothetical protein